MEEHLPEQSNVHRILDYKMFLTDPELRGNILSCDKIIVSGVFTLQLVLPFFPRKVLRKTYLQFWGGDFYCFRKRSKKNDILKRFMDYCVKHCAGVITLVASEKEEFFRMFPYDKKFFSVPVPNGPEEDMLLKKYRAISQSRPESKIRRIVIGNSSTPENQHMEVLEMLKHLPMENVEIYCPLSYGDSTYRKAVIEKGRELFGDAFHPITQYMAYEDYIDFLCSCSVGIYNLNRQQGMGNITILVNMGKKVYIRRDISLWNYYQSYGYKMNDIAQIPNQTIDELFAWSNEEKQGNYQALDYRDAKMLDIWTSIIDD